MHKLKLEALEVTSFETEAPDAERGTVAAHELSGLTCPVCHSIPTRVDTCCTPVV